MKKLIVAMLLFFVLVQDGHSQLGLSEDGDLNSCRWRLVDIEFTEGGFSIRTYQNSCNANSFAQHVCDSSIPGGNCDFILL